MVITLIFPYKSGDIYEKYWSMFIVLPLDWVMFLIWLKIKKKVNQQKNGSIKFA